VSTSVYSGRVKRVLYADPRSDFRILAVVLDNDSQGSTYRTVTAKGHFPAQQVEDGSWVSFEAKWIDHPQYGRQLQVTRSPVVANTWPDDKTLSALAAREVGPTTRRILLSHARERGMSLSDLLDTGDLSHVEGIEEFTAHHALVTWQSLRAYYDSAQFMSEAGIPPKIISKVWATFGSDLEERITQDPWILVRISGISFQEVDEIALKMGLSLDNPNRIKAAVLSAVHDKASDGHVFSTISQVLESVNAKIPSGKGSSAVSAQQVAQSIKDLSEMGLLIVDRETDPGLTAIYEQWHYEAEAKCAALLAERMQTHLSTKLLSQALCKVGDRVRDAKKAGADLKGLVVAALENWAEGRKTTLTEDQVQAALNAFTSKVSLLTGLPGTGKTTTLRSVVSILQDAEIPFLLVAPTGIAAKRMAAVTGADASTIHRAFGAKGFMQEEEEREATYVGITGTGKKKAGSEASGEWEYGPDNPHPARFMVMDETSMTDLHMLYRALTGTSPDCQIMLVGDPYQLPSVGSGDVLRDLVKAGVFAHSHLTQIFRQEDTSGIVLAAHAVHAGKTPQTDRKDFLIITSEDQDDAADKVVQIAERLYDKRLNFQVLSPRHAGDAGVTSLNQRLRLALNPAAPGLREMKLAGDVVREGDRIMVVKNNYELGTYNGDVGKVSSIDTKEKKIEIKIHEGGSLPPRKVTYSFSDASKSLRLAYAQTVHKSQGQEYDVIVIPVLPQFGRQLQRNLFYTAITRAKQKVFVVGTIQAVRKAVQNNKAQARNTLLDVRLRNLLGGSLVAVSG
jgi:exodeoxyribonuclease V alpha subunit